MMQILIKVKKFLDKATHSTSSIQTQATTVPIKFLPSFLSLSQLHHQTLVSPFHIREATPKHIQPYAKWLRSAGCFAFVIYLPNN